MESDDDNEEEDEFVKWSTIDYVVIAISFAGFFGVIDLARHRILRKWCAKRETATGLLLRSFCFVVFAVTGVTIWLFVARDNRTRAVAGDVLIAFTFWTNVCLGFDIRAEPYKSEFT